MRNLTRFLERQAVWAREVGLAEVVDEFGRNVLSELDYNGEAYNARRLAATMRDVDGVDIPRIHSGLSSARVLTMDFVDGVTITDVDRVRAVGLDPAALSECFLEGAVKQLLVDGFFHGDPHPGNVLVNLASPGITMIDMGMCGQLTVQQRFTLVQLVVVARRQDVAGMAQVMHGLSTPFRAVDESVYRRDFERRVGRFLDSDAAAPLGDAMSVGFDVLVQAEVIATTLRPDGGILTRGYEIAERLLREKFAGEELGKVGARGAEAVLLDLVRHAPALQEAAIRHVAPSTQPSFSASVPAVPAAASAPDPAASAYLVAAVTLAGVLVGCGLVAGAGAIAPGWQWLRDVAAVGFVAALPGIALLLLGVSRRIRGR
jgi:ubiquinone biosynthesis protein